MDTLEAERTARRGDGGRLRGIGDGVLLVEHLEDAVGGRARVEEEREEEPDRLHRPAQHRRHGEERDELGELQLTQLLQHDADAQAQREGDVGQQHEPEPDPADGARLVQLGLAQRLGLPGELVQGVRAAAEGLQHADAVDRLLDAGGEVTGLVLTLTREGAVGLLEPVAGVPQGRADDEERDPEGPVPAEQQRHADEDRQHVDHQQHDAEGHPPAQHAYVLHHAAEELSGLPAVVERDRQALQHLVEAGAQVVFHGGGRRQHEPAAQPHHRRFQQAQHENGDGAPDELDLVAGGDRALDEHLEHERDRQGEQARDERARGAHHETRQHRFGERVEPCQRPGGGESLGGRGHDPCEGVVRMPGSQSRRR